MEKTDKKESQEAMDGPDRDDDKSFRPSALPYFLPFVVFCGLTTVSSFFPQTLTWLYPLKTVTVAVLILVCWKYYEPLRPGHHLPAIAMGIFVCIVWVVPEGYAPAMSKESRIFDPLESLGPWQAPLWIGIRLIGASVVVAVMEEVFWRGFLIRWIINTDFRSVELGLFTWPSFIITSVLFGVEHHRWFVGILAGILYNLLLYRTKSLYACIVAHGVTNLCLGVYVITTKQWGFW
ncbi:MAG: CAAX prenyl protease-related protein [Desulfatiglandales bacterium]